MSNERDDKPSFKVVDKRAAQGASNEKIEAPKALDAAPKTESSGPREPINFSLFVQSLAHQAMLGLGIAPWPDSGLVRAEFGLAKEMIDILIMLQKKTANNLDQEEQTLIDTLVYQLQVAFLEITKKPTDDSVLIK